MIAILMPAGADVAEQTQGDVKRLGRFSSRRSRQAATFALCRVALEVSPSNPTPF